MERQQFYVLCACFLTICGLSFGKDEDEGPVIPPSDCEVCKFLALELRERLEETGKTKDVFETGHGLDTKKKKIKYNTSELRLIEALSDPHICDRILHYNIHKEREGSNRFAKGMSETFSTLHGLVNKGVKVDLGIPYELWDTPSAEVTQLQRQCFTIVERYEEAIEDWYYSNQERDIVDYLCRDNILKKDDQKCLDEKFVPKGETEEIAEEKPKKKSKGKKSKNNDINKKGEKGDSGVKTEL